LARIRSQIKRNRQNEKRRLRNRGVRGSARTAVKEARAAMDDGDTSKSKSTLLEAIRLLDKAAEKGVIHRNNAARRKSRLIKHFTTMEARPVEAEKAETRAAETIAEPESKKKMRRKETEAKKPADRKTAARKPAASKKSASKVSKTKAAGKKTARKK